MTVGQSIFTLTDVNSDLLFVKDKQSETLEFNENELCY